MKNASILYPWHHISWVFLQFHNNQFQCLSVCVYLFILHHLQNCSEKNTIINLASSSHWSGQSSISQQFSGFSGDTHTPKTKNQPGALYFPAIFESLREVMESRWVQNQFQIWMDGPGNGFKMTQNDQISPPKWRWKTAVLTLWTSVACDFTWFRVISRDFAWFGVNLGDFGWFWSSKIVHFGCLSHLKCQKWSFLKL